MEYATRTIVLMSLGYLFCNTPVFVNYLYYTCWRFSNAPYAEWYGGVVRYRYVWNVSAVLCVAGNATLNPALYFLRITEFRRFVKQLLARKPRNTVMVNFGTSETNTGVPFSTSGV